MIVAAKGNLLRADVDALVNTVNTVGVMGKGIALQFRRAYPQMFEEYQRAAKRGDLRPGSMHVWETGQLDGPRFIINFPTKQHWRSQSRLDDIGRGLDDLARVIGELGISSLALPPLGCGHGGLQWTDVEPLIRRKLAGVGARVELFGPDGPPPAADMPDGRGAEPLSVGRAALVEILSRYSPLAQGVSLVETQKLMYFLQVAGEPLRLTFVPGRYGPYADNLRQVLHAVEGRHLSGFGDGSAPVMESEPLSVLRGARDAAAQVLATSRDTLSRIDDVMMLVDGFESAYSLELLATTHWVATHQCRRDPTGACITREVQAWNPRKGRLFSDEHIEIARAALQEREWLRRPLVGVPQR
jgi:O-acetyl-ADP-ribose deacetylase (regulator of RNase III)